MAEQRVADAVAARQLLARVGLVVAVGVAEDPQVRDVGEVHVVAAHEHARGDAVERVGEAVVVNRRAVGLAVAVGVLDEPQPVGELRERRQVAVVPALDDLKPLLDGLRGQVVVEQVVAVADVVGAMADAAAVEAERLDDPEAALLVGAHRDGVGELRLGSEDFGRQTWRKREPPHLLGGQVERRRRVGHVERRGVAIARTALDGGNGQGC
jgi:hypothetical protein